MMNFAKYSFQILVLILIFPLICLFFYSNKQINHIEHATSNKILDAISREINYSIENNLKIDTVDTIEKLYVVNNKEFSKEEIKKIFKDCDVEFLNKFPNKITYYYEVKKENSPKIYSIVIAPYPGKDFNGVKVARQINPKNLKLPGPYFVELYSGDKINDKNLIDYIAPEIPPKTFFWFNKYLATIPLGIPNDKNISYKTFEMDKNYTRDAVTILVKTRWHISPANPYERRAGLIIIFIGAILLIGVARYINICFINPFIKLSAASKRVKTGDLNLNLKTKIKQKNVQETYNNFNDMVQGLKEKEELRSSFIRNLTHDLRTPLIAQERALSMISDKFIELNLKEEKELAKSLEKNTSHLLRMVNLILESYQFNLKKEDLNFESVNISKTVNDCFIKIKPIADEKKIKLINDINQSTIFYSDVTCFERIIINLCANAIENLSTGGYVRIFDEVINNKIKLTIEDNGNGISKEDLEHIFDRYYSSKSYTKKLGSGLGLDVVKKLVDIIDAKIEIESKVSEFTKFTITFDKREDINDKDYSC